MSPRHPPQLPAEFVTERGRQDSPHRSGLTGRKGYNAPLASYELTPPPSRHSTSPFPSHRDGLFGRKGYNSPPPSSSESFRSHSYSPAMGPSFHDGLSGRKGYNDAHAGMTVPSSERSRSMEPAPYASPHHREGALSGRKGYNASPSHSRDVSPAPSSSISHSRSPSPNPATFLSQSRRTSTTGALGGRKGYNGSPHLMPSMPSEQSHHHSHGANRGRKGYNHEHERTLSADYLTAEPEDRRKSRGEHHTETIGLGIREGGLGGRKGYNHSHDSSRSRSVSPMPLR